MTAYSLQPVVVDRHDRMQICDVTGYAETYGWVTTGSVEEVVGFLRGTTRTLYARSTGFNRPRRVSRTVGYLYDEEGDKGYRQVRPMFWMVRDGVCWPEVWSVDRKVCVFSGGSEPDWAALREAEIGARHDARDGR